MKPLEADSSSTQTRWRTELEVACSRLERNPYLSITPMVCEAYNTSQTRFVIFGTTDFALALLPHLRSRRSVTHFVDDFRAGSVIEGVPVIDSGAFLLEVARQPATLAINCSRYDRGIRHFADLAREATVPCVSFEQAVRLLQLGGSIDHRLSDWGPTIAGKLADYLSVGARFDDPLSRETFFAVLLSHVLCDREYRMQVCKPYSTLYFRSGLFDLSDDEKFVDCGASIGESTTALMSITHGQFARSWMIEPDRFNIQRLTQMIGGYAGTPLHDKFTLLPYAVGAGKGVSPFLHVGGHGGCIVEASDAGEVEVDSLEHLIDENPTFIKMDLEGHELPALSGAVPLLKKSRPKLALSAYHRAGDLLEIPTLVQKLDLGYRMGLRHHTEDRWDTCLYFY